MKKPETAPADAAKPAEGEKKPDAKAAVGVPEKYEFKAPEGQQLDAKAIEAITPLFKELGLTNDQAQKLVDFDTKRQSEAENNANRQYEDTRLGWRNEVIKDRDLGDGKAGLKSEAKANIDRAMQAIGDSKAIDAFKEAMDLTGAGDNPAVLRVMNTLGKLLSEGTAVRGAGPAATGQIAPGAGPKSAASALYPNLASSSQP